MWVPQRAVALVCLTASGLAFCGGGVALSTERPDDPSLAIALEALWTASFLGLLAVGLAARSAEPLGARLGLRAGRLPLGAVVLVALGALGVSQAVDAVIDAAKLSESGTLGLLQTSLSGARGGALAAALVCVGIAPAVAEELLFRGLVQRGLVHRLGPAGSVVAAAALFGAVHVDPIHASAAFGLGLYFGWVAHLAGSVRVPIACHAVNNLAAVVSTALWPGMGGTTPAAAGLGLLLGAAALAVAHRVRRPARGRADAGVAGSVAPVEAHGEPVAEAEEDAHQPAPDDERDQ